jgi:hypothetical protein
MPAADQTFSPNANGMGGAIRMVPTSAPTPLALGLNNRRAQLGN